MLSKFLAAADIPKIFRENKAVVFTNGCFDLLHEGHKHLLREAKKHGDILIVGLNTDLSVKRLKGESRPIENEQTRAEKLAGLPEVDHVILFAEETPARLIEMIKPDVLVKGGDYDENDIVGGRIVKSYGGRIVIISLLEGFSTTKAIENKD